MKELLIYIAKSLVEFPEAVEVSEEIREDATVLSLHVAESDMGKVIGKQGKIAKAILSVMKAAAGKENTKVIVDII